MLEEQVSVATSAAALLADVVPSDDPHVIALECLKAAPTRELATEMMRDIVERVAVRNPRHPLVAALIKAGVDLAIADAGSVTRRVIGAGMRTNAIPGTARPENSAPIARFQAVVDARLGPYDWAIWDGTKIGDATYDQLQDARDHHEKQSRGHQRRIAFYNEVMAAMRKAEARIVREALSEQELAKLQRRFANE